MAARVSPFQMIQPKGMYTTSNYVHGLRAGNTLYVAGQVARDEHGNLVGEGDVAVQARLVYKNIGTILAAAGADWRHIVKVTTYLLDRADSPMVTAVRHEHFGDHRPPHTGLIVAGLGSPGVRLEVDVIAVLPVGAAPRRRAKITRGGRGRRVLSRRRTRRR